MKRGYVSQPVDWEALYPGGRPCSTGSYRRREKGETYTHTLSLSGWRADKQLFCCMHQVYNTTGCLDLSQNIYTELLHGIGLFLVRGYIAKKERETKQRDQFGCVFFSFSLLHTHTHTHLRMHARTHTHTHTNLYSSILYCSMFSAQATTYRKWSSLSHWLLMAGNKKGMESSYHTCWAAMDLAAGSEAAVRLSSVRFLSWLSWEE